MAKDTKTGQATGTGTSAAPSPAADWRRLYPAPPVMEAARDHGGQAQIRIHTPNETDRVRMLRYQVRKLYEQAGATQRKAHDAGPN